MKNLNQFMKLYTHFEAAHGYFFVAHRNYLSVFDLTARPEYDIEADF